MIEKSEALARAREQFPIAGSRIYVDLVNVNLLLRQRRQC